MRRFALLALLLAVPAVAKPPRLVLFISIDSMGTDIFQRMRPRFKAGFTQLLAQGAYFPVAQYEVAETVTAVGHSTLATGTWPWQHGIVSNRVLNRQTGRLEPIFSDPGHPALEAPLANDDVSPVALLSETIADRLRISSQGRGKAIAIAGKARAAIPFAGRLGEAYWFNETVGRFVTGTYYRKEFPSWLKTFNDKKLPESYFDKPWTLLNPVADYRGDDDRAFESDWFGLGRTFPHKLSAGLVSPGPPSFNALSASPMMNEVMVQAAKAAMEGEALGKDDAADFLFVGFSATDKVYHLYGPYSWEAQDAIVRLDRSIAELVAAAEKAAGKGNLSVVVTADHGGAAIPEEWAAAGLPGVRVNPAIIDTDLGKELQAQFGVDPVVSIEEEDVYFDNKLIAEKKVDGARLRRAAAAWMSKHPSVALAVAKDDLEGKEPGSGLFAILRHGYNPERSGDVLFALKPFAVLESEVAGTSHGTPYAYDSEVPLILWGKNVKPGVFAAPIRAVDIAPTVTAILEIGSPAQAEGRARGEALDLKGN